MKNIKKFSVIFFAVLFYSICLYAGHTDKNPSEIIITVLKGDEFSGYKSEIEKYLSGKINISVTIKVLDYDVFNIDVERGNSSFYKGSPAEYIKSFSDTVLLRSVDKNTQTGEWTEYYTPVIITEKNISGINDIEKSKFYFTNPNSASGYLYPKLFFAKQNISFETIFPDDEDFPDALDVYNYVNEGKWNAACSFYGLLEDDWYFRKSEKIKVFEINSKIIRDPLWVNPVFKNEYPEITDKVAEYLYEFFSANPKYRLTAAKDSDYNDIRIKYRVLAVITNKDFAAFDKVAGMFTKDPEILEFVIKYRIHFAAAGILLFIIFLIPGYFIFRKQLLKRYIKENKIITEKYNSLVKSLKEEQDYNLQINKIESEIKSVFQSFPDFISDGVIVNYIATGEFLYGKYKDSSGIEPSAIANCYVKAFERVVMISAFGAEIFEKQDDVKVPDAQQNAENKINPKKILDNGIREIRIKAKLSNKEYKNLQKCRNLRNKVAHLKPVSKEEVVSIRKTLLGVSGYNGGIIALLVPYFKL